MALFDTDILIDHLRGKKEAMEVLINFKNEQNYCSAVTSGEILFGMKKGEKEKTHALLNSLEEISVDKEIIRIAHNVKERAKAYRLELIDCIIAATAIKTDQILVTRNAKHYPDKKLKLFVPDYK